MTSGVLHWSTTDATADDVLRRLIGTLDEEFPGRLLAVYVLGSYTDGSFTPISDIDLHVVFRGHETPADEQSKAEAVALECKRSSPIRLDLTLTDESSPGGGERHRVEVKLGGRLVWGDDVRDSIDLPPWEQHMRGLVRSACWFLGVVRGWTPTPYPLEYPDPDGEFFGYDAVRVPHWYPPDVESGTKELVVSVTRAAAALAALASGEYVASRSAALRIYRDRVGDESAAFIERLVTACRREWGYRIPSEPQQRAELRRLCRTALAFENSALEVFRTWLLTRLEAGDAPEREVLRESVGRFVDWDQEVSDRLSGTTRT